MKYLSAHSTFAAENQKSKVFFDRLIQCEVSVERRVKSEEYLILTQISQIPTIILMPPTCSRKRY